MLTWALGTIIDANCSRITNPVIALSINFGLEVIMAPVEAQGIQISVILVAAWPSVTDQTLGNYRVLSGNRSHRCHTRPQLLQYHGPRHSPRQ